MQINNLPIFKLNNNNSVLKRESFCSVNYPNLSPLKQDTISFKGEKVKKSDFQGVDLYILEKNRYDVQQFKSKNDIQKLAGEEIEKLTNKEYSGRQEETKVQRKAMLKEWFDYVIKENDAYSNTQKLVILSAATKDLKPNNDNIPPVLNKGVLADTVSELEEKLKNNSKEKFDFNKMYQNNLRKDLFEDTDTGETETKWVIIPSKENDPENFEKNVDKLKLLSHKTWCTKSFNAEPYLSKGDFHIYLENGQPKLGVRFEGNEVVEVQGEKNNGKIPVKYLDIFLAHQKENDIKLNSKAKKELINAQKTKELCKQIKSELGDFIELKTINDAKKVLNKLGIKNKRTKDGLHLVEYKQPSEGITFEDLDISENKLFKFITKIDCNMNFALSSVTNLGNLKSISGQASFRNSKVTDLGNLQSIGGQADFRDSQITSLGNLQSIGGYTDFCCSQITNLGDLQLIGGDADFSFSQIKELGNLQSIGGYADFKNSQIVSLGNLQSIGGGADFKDSQIVNLGKLQSIGGGADFKNSQIVSLGNLQSIGGSAEFNYSQIVDLGNLQSIGRAADFRKSQIKELRNLKSIGGGAYFEKSQITNLGELQSIGGRADFRDSQITSLGKLESIGGEADFRNSKVTNLGKLESIGGRTIFSDSRITYLGALQSIGEDADFLDSQITNLGKLKFVGGNVYYNFNKINIRDWNRIHIGGELCSYP